MHNEQGKSGGFFSKVMHMVRGVPSVPGATTGSDVDSQNNRELLREVVERKRRNDAIRQQEFAQLRQLRQRGALTSQGPQAAVTRTAAGFLPSMLGQAHDASTSQTLQKIDEIEAQMSGQWWQGAADSAVAQDAKAARVRHKPTGPALSQLPVLGEDSMVERLTQPPLEFTLEDVSMNTSQPFEPSIAPTAVVVGAASRSQAPAPVVVPVFKPHPDLEEAAILFAHGDLHGARTRLLEQLVHSLNSAPVDEDKVAVLWHAILDWCRATGDEETFEPLAIDYAEHFGRSAPLWFSIPGRLGMAALYGNEEGKVTKRQVQWSSPAMMTVGSVNALRAAHQGADQPWSMSWSRLTSIDPAALHPLAMLLDEWAGSNGQFVVSDAGRLLSLIEVNSPTGDSSHGPQWWTLRMAVLRWMNRMDEYEQVALDYCITYEVSPPSWLDPRCLCVVQESGEADISLLHEASMQSTLAQKGDASGTVPAVAVLTGLTGVIEGDVQVRLDAIAEQASQKGSKTLDIACDNLIRLDFVAAGGVLNWAAEMQSQGYELKFTQLHQLVAVFFHIIGIQEHATIQATLA